MDVVIPLANASKYRDDFELRYSLRAWARQRWIRNVIVIGHCPAWLNTKAFHIPCGDPYVAQKDANMINKILLACSKPEITEDFVVSSDDQYPLQPITPDDLTPYLEYPCRLDEYKYKVGVNTWYKRVVATVKWCKDNGYATEVYQSHVPYLVNKYKYPETMANVPWGAAGFTTHVYLNMTTTRPAENEPVGRTLRVKRNISDTDLRNQVKDATFFNHNDAGLCPAVKHFLESYFPTPSKWER